MTKGFGDNGAVLRGLNVRWTFLGANALEWCSGFVMFMLVSLFSDSLVAMMPAMILSFCLTTFTLASMRKSFPDEERGVRNVLLTLLGICPPNSPPPASLCPIWSQSPLRYLDPKSKLVKLGLQPLLVPEEIICKCLDNCESNNE